MNLREPPDAWTPVPVYMMSANGSPPCQGQQMDDCRLSRLQYFLRCCDLKKTNTFDKIRFSPPKKIENQKVGSRFASRTQTGKQLGTWSLHDPLKITRFMTPLFRVMTPFLKGHEDSRWFSQDSRRAEQPSQASHAMRRDRQVLGRSIPPGELPVPSQKKTKRHAPQPARNPRLRASGCLVALHSSPTSAEPRPFGCGLEA